MLVCCSSQAREGKGGEGGRGGEGSGGRGGERGEGRGARPVCLLVLTILATGLLLIHPALSEINSTPLASS